MDQDIFSGGGRGEYLDLERVVAFYTGSYFYLQPRNRERGTERERGCPLYTLLGLFLDCQYILVLYRVSLLRRTLSRLLLSLCSRGQ